MHAVSYVSLGCFITLAIFLLAATLHYRKKFNSLKQLKSMNTTKPEQKYKIHENNFHSRQPSGGITLERNKHFSNFSDNLYHKDLVHQYQHQLDEDMFHQQRATEHGGRGNRNVIEFWIWHPCCWTLKVSGSNISGGGGELGGSWSFLKANEAIDSVDHKT